MTIDLPMITITEGIAQPYKQQAKVTNFWLSTNYMWEFLLRGEAQAKSGKKEQTQGHLKKKISDMQWQIRQTTKDIARLWICMNTCRKTSHPACLSHRICRILHNVSSVIVLQCEVNSVLSYS